MKLSLSDHHIHENHSHESEGHAHHNHDSHESHDHFGHKKETSFNEPYRFKSSVFLAGSFGAHYLPKPFLSSGLDVSVLFGVQQAKKHFLLGPSFQWSQGKQENYGIKSHVSNFFIGAEINFGRVLGKNLNISGGPVLGLRYLDATSLILDQGIIFEQSKQSAFELQGQLKFSLNLFRGLGLFAQFRIGNSFYLVEQDVMHIGGFNLSSSLGFYFSNL